MSNPNVPMSREELANRVEQIIRGQFVDRGYNKFSGEDRWGVQETVSKIVDLITQYQIRSDNAK